MSMREYNEKCQKTSTTIIIIIIKVIVNFSIIFVFVGIALKNTISISKMKGKCNFWHVLHASSFIIDSNQIPKTRLIDKI